MKLESNTSTTTLLRVIIIAILLSCIVYTQFLYDNFHVALPAGAFSLSPRALRSFVIGLHSATAAYAWIFGARDDLANLIFTKKDLVEPGYRRFQSDFDAVTALDPRWSTPYAFTLMALPLSKYGLATEEAIRIGKQGLAVADADWHIPFYIAALYHTELGDKTNAARYFDIAARTPGIPNIVRTFALNFGVFPTARAQSKELWRSVYETAQDNETRTRAEMYLRRFAMLDLIDEAVKQYRKTYSAYPSAISDLVTNKIISEIPTDPFGFEFGIDANGIVEIEKP
jgi:hypothetical protein